MMRSSRLTRCGAWPAGRCTRGRNGSRLRGDAASFVTGDAFGWMAGTPLSSSSRRPAYARPPGALVYNSRLPMCGICGAFYFGRSEPVSLECLEAMSDTIIHRGPDDAGLHISPNGALGWAFVV